MKVIFFFLLLTLSVCCTERENNDTKAAEAVVMGIIEADNRSDIEAVVNYYSANAILMPPGRPTIQGTDAIRKNYKSIFETSQVSFQIEISETKVADKWAVCAGRTFGTVTLKTDSSTRKVDDKFVMILAKEKNQWKIERLIWN